MEPTAAGQEETCSTSMIKKKERDKLIREEVS
jgi:hypothetical protein